MLSQVRASSQRTMESRNRMNCGERIRTFAANSLDKCVNASGQTTVYEGSFPNTMANKYFDEYKMKVNHKEPGSDPTRKAPKTEGQRAISS